MTFETIKQGDSFVPRGIRENRDIHTVPCSKAKSLFRDYVSWFNYVVNDGWSVWNGDRTKDDAFLPR